MLLALLVLHNHRAGQGGLPLGGGDAQGLELSGLLQGHGQDNIAPILRSGEPDGFRIIHKEVLQIAVNPDARRKHQLPDVLQVHRRSQQGGAEHLGAALRLQLAVDIGQIHDVDGPVTVEVIARQILTVGGAQGLGEGLPVLLRHPAAAVEVAQGEGRVAGAQDDMAGVGFQLHGHLGRNIPLTGEAQGILPRGEVVDGQVQISGPAVLQVPAVAVPGRDNGGILGAQRILPRFRHPYPAQGCAVPPQLGLHLPGRKGIQGLGVVDAQGGGDAAGDAAFLRPGGPGAARRQERENQRCAQQQGQQSVCDGFHSRDSFLPRRETLEAIIAKSGALDNHQLRSAAALQKIGDHPLYKRRSVCYTVKN